MEKYELLEHIRQVVKLETQCYGFEQLLSDNEGRRQQPKKLPKKPIAKVAAPARKPVMQHPQIVEQKPPQTGSINCMDIINEMADNSIPICSVFIISIFVGIYGGIKLANDFLFGLIGYFLLSFAIGFALIFLFYLICQMEGIEQAKKRAQEQQGERNDAALQRYNIELEQCRAWNHQNEQNTAIANAQALQRYETAYHEAVNHNSKVETANMMLDEVQQTLVAVIANLRRTLAKVYNLGYIHPNYRNYIAYTMFHDYLDTGRCDELEGPDGAYNMLELEIRLDHIIYQLDEIINNLLHIRQNQCYLFNEISRANQNIKFLTACVCDGLDYIANTQGYLTYEASQSFATTQNISRKVDSYVADSEKTNREVLRYLEDAKRRDRSRK